MSPAREPQYAFGYGNPHAVAVRLIAETSPMRPFYELAAAAKVRESISLLVLRGATGEIKLAVTWVLAIAKTILQRKLHSTFDSSRFQE
jgi:hypothetical protein